MPLVDYVSYLVFIVILVIGVLYLYWLDDRSIIDAEDAEDEEGDLGLDWIPFHKLINDVKDNVNKHDEKVTTDISSPSPSPSPSHTNAPQEANWFCKVEDGGKNIELVKPIEHYVSSGGSQFASID